MEEKCPREAFSCEPWWWGLRVRLCNWCVCDVMCVHGVLGGEKVCVRGEVVYGGRRCV